MEKGHEFREINAFKQLQSCAYTRRPEGSQMILGIPFASEEFIEKQDIIQEVDHNRIDGEGLEGLTRDNPICI